MGQQRLGGKSILAVKNQTIVCKSKDIVFIFLLSGSEQSWYEEFVILIIYIKLEGPLKKP